jgi:hypothetical protein
MQTLLGVREGLFAPGAKTFDRGNGLPHILESFADDEQPVVHIWRIGQRAGIGFRIHQQSADGRIPVVIGIMIGKMNNRPLCKPIRRR